MNRQHRPVILYLIIVAYVVAPFANVALLRFFVHLPLAVVMQRLLAGYGYLATIWLCTAPIVGIALYFAHPVTWYLFLGHSALILADYAIKWATRGSYYLHTIGGLYSILIATGNLALIAAVALILTKNLRAPYLRRRPGSWRATQRIPLNHWITLGGVRRRTTDVSEGGCHVIGKIAGAAVGETVGLELRTEDFAILSEATFVRQDDVGYGLKFQHLGAPARQGIRRMQKRRISPRYRTDIECKFRFADIVVTGALLDISKEGCYVTAEVPELAADSIGELSIDKWGFQSQVRTSWINGAQETMPWPGAPMDSRAAQIAALSPAGKACKPMGFGCQFVGQRGRLMKEITAHGVSLTVVG